MSKLTIIHLLHRVGFDFSIVAWSPPTVLAEDQVDEDLDDDDHDGDEDCDDHDHQVDEDRDDHDHHDGDGEIYGEQ